MQLSNGATVSDFTATCAHCGQPVAHEMVSGRISDSLPTVKTLDANVFCVTCQRLIAINGRFREVGSSFRSEFADQCGRWHAVCNPENAPSPVRLLFARLASILGLGRLHGRWRRHSFPATQSGKAGGLRWRLTFDGRHPAGIRHRRSARSRFQASIRSQLDCLRCTGTVGNCQGTRHRLKFIRSAVSSVKEFDPATSGGG